MKRQVLKLSAEKVLVKTYIYVFAIVLVAIPKSQTNMHVLNRKNTVHTTAVR